MMVTHYNVNSFDPNPDNLFHWALIRDEVARDVDVARQSSAHASNTPTARREAK